MDNDSRNHLRQLTEIQAKSDLLMALFLHERFEARAHRERENAERQREKAQSMQEKAELLLEKSRLEDHVAGLKRHIAGLDSHMAVLNDRLKLSEEMAASLMASSSWRLTAPLRWIKARISR